MKALIILIISYNNYLIIIKTFITFSLFFFNSQIKFIILIYFYKSYDLFPNTVLFINLILNDTVSKF